MRLNFLGTGPPTRLVDCMKVCGAWNSLYNGGQAQWLVIILTIDFCLLEVWGVYRKGTFLNE